NYIPEQVYQKYTPEEERPPDHRGILRYGGRKVHEIICTNRPVPNGTLGGVRGSDDTYSIVLRTMIYDFFQIFGIYGRLENMADEFILQVALLLQPKGMSFRPVTNQFILDDIPDFICFFVVLVTGKHISEDCQKDCRCSQPLLTINDFFHFSSVAFSGIRDHRSKKVAGRIFFCVGFFIKVFQKSLIWSAPHS
ncbi:hypothetical protein, partial [Faecalibaculum rodentium]|uniref:hypothetical protein n=3 Tax=Faecalibaculum rodentium TaxID=1702221 RepID=UPI00259BD6F6